MPGDCPEPDQATRCIPRGLVNRAVYVLRDIIRSYGYPRAYFTLGRLLANLGRYGEAESLISEAIRLEDPRVKDYMFRLAEYYNYLFPR